LARISCAHLGRAGGDADAFAAGAGDRLLEPCGFGREGLFAESGEAVVAAAFVVGEAGFDDEAAGEEAVDGAVERAGAHGDVLAGFEHDGVAVFFAVGEREEDGEDGWGEGEMAGWGFGVRAHGCQYMSVTDISSSGISRCMRKVGKGFDFAGLEGRCMLISFPTEVIDESCSYFVCCIVGCFGDGCGGTECAGETESRVAGYVDVAGAVG